VENPTHPFPLARVQRIVLLLVTCAGLYLTLLIAKPFVWPIVTAALLAVGVQLLFTKLLRYVRHRSAAALLFTIATFLALLLPTVSIVNVLANETMMLYAWLNEQNPGFSRGLNGISRSSHFFVMNAASASISASVRFKFGIAYGDPQ
jgi:predicted PurR-regulated permease PerM